MTLGGGTQLHTPSARALRRRRLAAQLSTFMCTLKSLLMFLRMRSATICARVQTRFYLKLTTGELLPVTARLPLEQGMDNSRDAVLEKGTEAEEEEIAAAFARPPVAELQHTPKDPRTAAGWNVFSRLLFT